MQYQLNFPNSLVILTVGLSIVFSFLIILVIAVQLSHIVVRALKLDIESTPGTPKTKPTGIASGINNEIVAAITIAVNKFEGK